MVLVRHVLALIVFAVPAGAGTVETVAGASHEGAVSLGAGGVTVRRVGRAPVTVPLAEVAVARFDSPAGGKAAAALLSDPAEWVKGEVGAGKGKVEAGGGRVTVYDTGKGLGSPKQKQDDCFFVHQKVRGDVTLVARLRVMDDGRLARAGLMVRAGLGADAAFAMVGRSSEGRTGVIRRSVQGAVGEEVARSERRIAGATWLKLERRGNTFTASESTDGAAWVAVGSVEVPADDEVLAGLACATGGGREGRTLFDHVSVTAADAAADVGRRPRGVMMRGGTMLAGEVTAVEAGAVTVVLAVDGRPRKVPAGAVAWCGLAPLLPAEEGRVRGGRPGVLLVNGDWLEGDVGGLADGQVKVTSVLFGARTIDARRDAAAVVLGPVEPAGCAFEVRLADRSVVRATAVIVGKDGLTLEDGAVGRLTVAAGDVVEIRKGEGPRP